MTVELDLTHLDITSPSFSADVADAAELAVLATTTPRPGVLSIDCRDGNHHACDGLMCPCPCHTHEMRAAA